MNLGEQQYLDECYLNNNNNLSTSNRKVVNAMQNFFGRFQNATGIANQRVDKIRKP